VVQASNVLAGLTRGAIAVLVLTGRADLTSLVVLAALNGLAVAPGLPALNGMVPQLVPRAELQQANALISLTRATLMVTGPGASAALVVTVGPGWALLVDAVTSLAAAALLLPVRPTTSAVEPAQAPSVLGELRQGWDYFRATTWLWVVVAACAVLNGLAEGGLTALGPVRADHTSIGADGWGLAMSVQALGALVTTLVLLRWRVERPLLVGLLGGSMFGLPMIALGAWPSLTPLLATAFLSGVGAQMFSLSWHVAMQEQVPEHLLSRAYSYDQVGSFAVIPLGQLALGPLAGAFGLAEVLTAAGVVYVAVALLTLSAEPVRSLTRLAPPVPGRAAATAS
jgi:MFS family permease